MEHHSMEHHSMEQPSMEQPFHGATFHGASLEQADFRSKKVSGIGLWISRGRSGFYYVSLIYKDTPAFDAGIRRGDRIVLINKQNAEKIEIEKAHNLIFDKPFAKPGTKVTLTIERNNQKKEYSLISKSFTMSVQGLTPEQVKEANNWEKAYYDPELAKQLGLPPQ